MKDNLLQHQYQLIDEYRKTPLKLDDLVLLTPQNHSVYMPWETRAMIEHANAVGHDGARVFNTGYGFGIFDTEIEKFNLSGHVIVECHPQVYEIAKKDGWTDRDDVDFYFNSWHEVYKDVGKFDAIFFDTFGGWGVTEFFNYVPNMLNNGGLFTWFNPTDDSFLNMLDESLFEISFKEMKITNKELTELKKLDQDSYDYWNKNGGVYKLPVARLK